MGKGKKYITDILDITNDSGSIAPSFSYDPIDVGTFLGTNITASVNAQDSSPEALFFKPDGLKMYLMKVILMVYFSHQTGFIFIFVVLQETLLFNLH